MPALSVKYQAVHQFAGVGFLVKCDVEERHSSCNDVSSISGMSVNKERLRNR